MIGLSKISKIDYTFYKYLNSFYICCKFLHMRNTLISIVFFCLVGFSGKAQLNTDKVLNIGKNALYFQDYVLAIQYFNKVIEAKPYLAESFYLRAVAKYYLEDYGGAYADCSTALGINPYQINVYNLRGICLSQLDEIELAISDYQTGLNYSPYNENLLNNYVRIQVASEAYDLAMEKMEKLMSVKKDFRDFIMRGWIHLGLGDTVSARADFNEAIERKKDAHEAYAARASLEIMDHAYEDALKDMNRAVSLQSDNTNYLFNRGLVYYYLDQWTQAMKDYDRVLLLDEYNQAARFNRALLRSRVGDRGGALQDFNELLGLDPDNHIARYNRILLLVEMKDYHSALKELGGVLSEYPDFSDGYLLRASVYTQLGRVAEAQRDMNTSYVLRSNQQANNTSKQEPMEGAEDEDAGAGKKTRSATDLKLSNYDKLVMIEKEKGEEQFSSDIRGRIQNNNIDIREEDIFGLSAFMPAGSPNHYFMMELNHLNKKLQSRSIKFYLSKANEGLSQEQVSELFELIDTYSSLLHQGATEAHTYLIRGLYWLMVQDYQAALSDFDACIKLDAEHVLAYFCRANAYFRMGELKDAGSSSLEGMELSFDDASVLAQGSELKGSTLANVQYKLAIKDYQKALSLSPRMYLAVYNRGNAQLRLQDYKGALASFMECIELNPGMGEAYFNKGLIEIYFGNIEQGNKDLSKAGELGVFNAYNVIKRHAGQVRLAE